MSTKYSFPSYVSVQSFVTMKLSDKGMYNLWKTQMLCLLESHDMLGFIKTSASMDYDRKRSDSLVKGWILGSLSEHVAIEVLSRLESKSRQHANFTAKETWDEVQQIMYGEQADRKLVAITGDASASASGEGDKDVKEMMKETMDSSKNKEQLYLVAESGSLKDFRSILQKSNLQLTEGISINGNTALHVAAGNRKDGFLKSLLSNDIQLMDVRNSEGSTLLHVAASVGNEDAAKILMEACPDLLFAKDKEGYTPLDIILSKPWNTKCLFLLLSKMRDIEQPGATFLSEEVLVNAISYGYFV